MTDATLLKETQLDLRPAETVRDAYERIQQEATSNAQKGRWFEHLFISSVRNLPEFDVEEVWVALGMLNDHTDKIRARKSEN